MKQVRHQKGIDFSSLNFNRIPILQYLNTFFLQSKSSEIDFAHGLRTPGEKIAFTVRPKIKSQSQLFRYIHMSEVYFVFHIITNFQISLIYTFIWCPQCVILQEQCTFQPIFLCHATDYGRPERAFSWKSQYFGLGQTNWDNNFWYIFGRNISPPFGCSLSIFSINQPLFLQKHKLLIPNPEHLFGIGISIRVFVVRESDNHAQTDFYGLSKYCKMLVFLEVNRIAKSFNCIVVFQQIRLQKARPCPSIQILS